MIEWLKDAIFYEIYPQTFKDSNADGIGDINGIIEKLDYIRDLGCNAIWMNPCFDSPFVDAGYDVRDYYKVAPRYGTNEDLKHLFAQAHERGMHVILDLVPGHTSSECSWFKESCKAERNAYTDRYVWSDSIWNAPTGIGRITGWLRGGYERNGSAAVNFFTAQPALNYGFYEKDEGQTWQQDIHDEGPVSTRKELLKIMKFWLSLGCDGFRVDMAGSLVKNDPDNIGIISLWQEIFSALRPEFPEAAFVSEWGEPDVALQAGFDMDFLLHFGPSHYLDLFRTETPYFGGKGNLKEFFTIYMKNMKKTEGKGMICIPSGNHDMDRMAETLSVEQMKMAFAFLLTMPGVPFIYYGDEIGMRKIHNLPSEEGGYNRTGSRTPMQWDNSVNCGFSSACEDMLYLPIDTEMADTINVKAQRADSTSLYHEVKKLIRMRIIHPALANTSEFELLYANGNPVIYRRFCDYESLIIAFNPSDQPCSFSLPQGEVIYSFNDLPFDPNTLPPHSAYIISM